MKSPPFHRRKGGGGGKEGGGAPGQDNDVKILLIDDAAQVEIYQVSVIPVALYIIKHDTFCFFSKLSRVNCQDIMVLIIYGIVYRLNPFYILEYFVKCGGTILQ